MIEVLAAYAHEAWAGWMQWLFKHGTLNSDGTFTINAEKTARWLRQAQTSYADLSPEEQESDRTEARKMLHAIAGEMMKQ